MHQNIARVIPAAESSGDFLSPVLALVGGRGEAFADSC
jgi:hypothetical protein